MYISSTYGGTPSSDISVAELLQDTIEPLLVVSYQPQLAAVVVWLQCY